MHFYRSDRRIHFIPVLTKSAKFEPATANPLRTVHIHFRFPGLHHRFLRAYVTLTSTDFSRTSKRKSYPFEFDSIYALDGINIFVGNGAGWKGFGVETSQNSIFRCRDKDVTLKKKRRYPISTVISYIFYVISLENINLVI